jgi:hypothetical protein
METLFVFISGVLLMISAILGEQLYKKLRIAIWILFVILLISYSYINIKMENARKIEKGKDDTKISDLTKINQQMLEINKQLLQVVKAPDFAKNPETLSKVDKIEKNLSSIGNNSKAILRFTFCPYGQLPQTLIDTLRVPTENGIITVYVTVKNISTVQTNSGGLWIQICDRCKYAEEPEGLIKISSNPDTVRIKNFNMPIPAGVFLDPIKLKIIPPSQTRFCVIALRYGCDRCVPLDNEHPQKLTVTY